MATCSGARLPFGNRDIQSYGGAFSLLSLDPFKIARVLVSAGPRCKRRGHVDRSHLALFPYSPHGACAEFVLDANFVAAPSVYNDRQVSHFCDKNCHSSCQQCHLHPQCSATAGPPKNQSGLCSRVWLRPVELSGTFSAGKTQTPELTH